MTLRPTRRGIVLVASIALAVAALVATGCKSTPNFRGQAIEPPMAAPKLTGTTHAGQAFALSELKGKPVVLFFGYTFCPDVCPFTLARVRDAMEVLGSRSGEVGVVFVTVDPERDTQQKLSRYMAAFDSRFIGLRLDPAEQDALLLGFGVHYEKGEATPDDPYYTVDHTGTIFLIDRQGQIRVHHDHSAPVDLLVPDIRALLDG